MTVEADSHDRLPKKVLHVLNSASGGSALSTIELMNSLRLEGIDSLAVCHNAGTTAEREMLREATRGKVLFVPLYWWNRKIRAARWKRPLLEVRQILQTGWGRRSSARVAEFAQRHEVDLIHTNTILTPEGGTAAAKLGLPHVWHVRELVGPGKPFRLPKEGPAFGQYLSKHSSKVIANSHTTAAQVRDWMNADLLEVVPNGIDVSQYQIRPDCRKGEFLVVAMVGNANTRLKKHHVFIEAAAQVDRSLRVEFRVYGHDAGQGGRVRGDSYVDDLHDRVRHYQLGERFRWLGFVAPPQRIMAEIDVLVHPADQESFCRVAAEAMAAGLPVIGVRGGGVSEIVREGTTGLLADPDSSEQIAAHIETLAADPSLRKSLGRAGRTRVEQHYSLRACATGVMAVYRAAMKAPVGRGVSSQAACPA